jgi:hypothetical protein
MQLFMKRITSSVLLLIAFLNSYAGRISGTITDINGTILPYASITVKGSSKGAIANSQGKYSIYLEPGNYTLVCQYVGYKTEEKNVSVGSGNSTVDFHLSIQELKMAEVVIKRGEDPAIAIIRETIRKRDLYNRQVDSFSVDVYIKGLLRSRAIPDKIFGQKVDKGDMAKEGIDSLGKGILFLSESQTKVSYRKPDKLKYEVISSRQSGGGYGLSFPFFINFYTNNVEVFDNSLNPRGFISPISDNAFHYYKFRYEGNFFEGDKMIDRIKVTPRRKNEPLFSGYLQIIDGEWRIHSLELTTTSDYQLELIDTLRITQIHSPVSQDIWKTQNQVVYVAVKKFGFDMAGNFLNVYSNYNLKPGFIPKHFNRILMTYDTAFDKKDSSYWNATRPVPLEPDEKRDFVFKDSISKEFGDTMFSSRNIDSLRKNQKPVRFGNFFKGGVDYSFYSPKSFSTYRLEPLIKKLEYNTVEGLSIKVEQSLNIRPRKGIYNYDIDWNTRLGTSNLHLNSFLNFTLQPKQDHYRNRFLTLSGGKRLYQINKENPIGPLMNSLYTLLAKKNYMKLYEAWFGQVQYNNQFENGLRWNINAFYEDRIPLENSTDYSFFKTENTLLPNHPYELANVPFERHKAFVTTLTLTYQPGQHYIQFPANKVSVGSQYPTLALQYTKGIKGMLGSVVDFDKWKFSVFDDMNFKMGGQFRYRLSVGGFFNTGYVGLPDYQHFNGNQTFYNSKYLNSFQLAPYYQYSNIEKLYGLVHVEHHFNGLLTNKIPLFNKLKWNLVIGSNTFYVNQNNYYVEAFAGIENIFKLFRIDFVTAYQAQPGQNFGVRIGLGGLIGRAIQLDRD